MPIEVHCPNPVCARIHSVKDKYAGMRGKCPTCGSWMYIPELQQVPAPRPEAVDTTLPWTAPAQRSALGEALQEPPLRVRDEEDDRPARGKARPEEPTEGDPKLKPRFSWAAAVFLVLGMLSLGAVAATPFLDVGEFEATGVFATDYGSRKPEGIKKEFKTWVMAVPGGIAGMALLSLLAGMILKRFGIVSLFLVWLATVGSAGLLFIALTSFRNETRNKEKIEESVAKGQETGKSGEVTITLGQYLYAGLGGAAGACLFFVLAGVAMLRRWWGRMLGFLFLASVPALLVTWILLPDFRKLLEDLGIPDLGQYLPAI
jgi:hypothetical protein